jgi:hypothetical protein
VIPPFQQLTAAAPPTRAQAIDAGIELSYVNNSAAIEFEICDGRIAVVRVGVRLFADIVICCGPVSPSIDVSQTSKVKDLRVRFMQNEHFTVIGASHRRLYIERMLQRLLDLRNKMLQIDSSGRNQSDVAVSTS